MNSICKDPEKRVLGVLRAEVSVAEVGGEWGEEEGTRRTEGKQESKKEQRGQAALFVVSQAYLTVAK